MPDSFKAAAVQMSSGENKPANLEAAERLIREATSSGARLVALPEMFCCLGRFEAVVENAEPIPGPTSERMSALARELDVFLLAGSMPESCGDRAPGKAWNTSLLFGPGGNELARYRKRHLFDVDIEDGPAVCESAHILAGVEPAAARTALGVIGQSICYDLRFPEHFRALADLGAEIVMIPSAFTKTTGQAHWEILLRARAIENQAFVIAPNQDGRHEPDLETYGHSMIVDPWGEILARAEEGEAVITAEISLSRLQRIRRQIPALRHRRP